MKRSATLTAAAMMIAPLAVCGQIVKKSDNKRFPEADSLYDQPDVTVPVMLAAGEAPHGYNPHVAVIDRALGVTTLAYATANAVRTTALLRAANFRNR